MRRPRLRVGLGVHLAAALLIVGCEALASPSPTRQLPATTPSPAATVPTPSVSVPTASPAASPSPTPEPELSLELPTERDERSVRVTIAPEVATDGGGIITVSVTNLAAERIDEIVLRWPTELGAHLFLAPFLATEDRIRDGGPPLVQDWTKWVVGPGERGEPAGTTSLGYGPVDAGTQLDVPIYVTRIVPGPVEFDLQLLAGDALMTLEGGAPAELRVQVP